ncbi:MAG: anaerobic ribonucleoside-triphosphate reductase activating protein [Candidatus Omnitrophica bacterium]|nr:anaerobic ribonucleoside-triphosphate reductase activating protein [Candidatus Omnitrophota bacterium]
MALSGIVKKISPHTLLEWDGKIAAVFYTSGCNFRCSFCHSGELIRSGGEGISPRQIRDFLKSQRDALDGVVISGGEPTMHAQLPRLLEQIKQEGLAVKLDTNGTNPAAVQALIAAGLVDYVAMDIKAPLERRTYERLVEAGVDIAALEETIAVLIQSAIDYEFRTTVIPGILLRQDILSIAQRLRGACRYVLQQFQPEITYAPAMQYLSPYTTEELWAWAERAREYVGETYVRCTSQAAMPELAR